MSELAGTLTAIAAALVTICGSLYAVYRMTRSHSPNGREKESIGDAIARLEEDTAGLSVSAARTAATTAQNGVAIAGVFRAVQTLRGEVRDLKAALTADARRPRGGPPNG